MEFGLWEARWRNKLIDGNWWFGVSQLDLGYGVLDGFDQALFFGYRSS